MSQAPYYPIVYVRGFAGSQGEVEDTVADPYMGFNAGSTKLRQRWTGKVEAHVFESPLLRLMKDYQYTDTYCNGSLIGNGQSPGWRSVWIYRYYDQVSNELGQGKRPEIETYAEGLGEFLNTMRDTICGDDQQARADFKVYLVAHSMGGLVVRCWLQNLMRKQDNPVPVDKVFTYATPHGGIDLKLVGNLPGWLRLNNTENFNDERMRDYLAIDGNTSVKSLENQFDPNRFFCLVGTNARDYDAALGLSRRAVGNSSDGLVQIKNAYTYGSPRAFVHRAHSGHYGIVNSEEGYQNLVRFFFGDLRVDGLLRVKDLPLPKKVQQAQDAGKKIRASYHIEVSNQVRGARWELNRRSTEHQSAILAKYDEIRDNKKAIHLFSSFLSKSALTNKNSRYLTFAMELGVLVPEYEIDNFLFDEHFEGSYIFRDTLIIGVQATNDGEVKLRYGWNSDSVNNPTKGAELSKTADGWRCSVPVERKGAPGIIAELELVCRPN